MCMYLFVYVHMQVCVHMYPCDELGQTEVGNSELFRFIILCMILQNIKTSSPI